MDEWRRDLIDNFVTGGHSTTTWTNFDPKKVLPPPPKILNYIKFNVILCLLYHLHIADDLAHKKTQALVLCTAQ